MTQGDVVKSKANLLVLAHRAKKSPARCTIKIKRCYLLELPGELRNLIYSYIFGEPGSVCRPNCYVKRSWWKIVWPATELRSYRPLNSGWNPRIEAKLGPDKSSGYSTAVVLLQTCRAIALEIGPILYGDAIFAFGAPHGVQNFLEGVHHLTPPIRCPIMNRHRHAILKLRLNALAYGEPRIAADRIWKRRYYECWGKACRLIVTKMPNVTEIKLLVAIPVERPFKACLESSWVQPWLELSRLKKLQTVEVRFHEHKRFTSTGEYQLQIFGDMIRRKILGQSDAEALMAVTEAGEMLVNVDDTQEVRLLKKEIEQLKQWNCMK